MVQCPTCGHLFDQTITTCPQCRHKKARMRTLLRDRIAKRVETFALIELYVGMIIGGIVILIGITVLIKSLINKEMVVESLYLLLLGLAVILGSWIYYILLSLFTEMLRTLGRIEDQGLDKQIGTFESVSAGDKNQS